MEPRASVRETAEREGRKRRKGRGGEEKRKNERKRKYNREGGKESERRKMSIYGGMGIRTISHLLI